MRFAAFAAAATLVLLAGCGSDDAGTASEARTIDSAETATKAPKPEQPATASDPTAIKVWFTAGEQFHPVDRGLPPSGSTLSAAIEALLEGPRAGEAAGDVPAETQIPPSVALENASLDGEGIAIVQLSPAFLDGIPPDPESRDLSQRTELNARLAQVTYTATQFSDVDGAKVLAGGTLITRDISREDYAKPEGGPPQISKKKGRKLPRTRQVQKRLAKLGFLPSNAIDGRAGYWTQQAVTAFQAWNGLDRDGVVGPATAAALKTAKRPVPGPGGPTKRLEVYREKGVTLEIEGGRVVRAIHTASGGPGTETPAGRFTIGRKELRSWSVPFQTWLPYASYFNAGIAFHEYPDVPAFPASHGCVRVPAPEAPGVYEFAGLGTTVVVV